MARSGRAPPACADAGSGISSVCGTSSSPLGDFRHCNAKRAKGPRARKAQRVTLRHHWYGVS
eukprot:2178866-Alexandrium_andersonii.AAC.1